MLADRITILQQIEQIRQSKVILYVTGDRPRLNAQIHSEVYDYFVNILDKIGVVDKISLILYTRGGDTLAAWSIVNLIRQYCDNFEVIVPNKAQSAGTLIAIGANTIMMTKQATLGPVDPSINTPLNPKIDDNQPNARMPVSVEAVNGFVELAKSSVGNADSETLKDIFVQLAQKVHPLVLGEVFRSQSQIGMLAKKLLLYADIETSNINKIVSFLRSESGSHDYTIHRREAKKLGLNVKKPSSDFYLIIKNLYDDFANKMKFAQTWDPVQELQQKLELRYNNKLCILESVT